MSPFAAPSPPQHSKTNKGTNSEHCSPSFPLAWLLTHGNPWSCPRNCEPGQAFIDSPVQVTSACPKGQLSQDDRGSSQAAIGSLTQGAPTTLLPMKGLHWQCHRVQTPLKSVCHWLLDFSRHCAAGKNTAAIKGGSLLAGIL